MWYSNVRESLPENQRETHRGFSVYVYNLIVAHFCDYQQQKVKH